MIKVFANHFWVFLPNTLQLKISKVFSLFFELKISRLLIRPYCSFFGLNSEYLGQFESESGNATYGSYSDFFRRRYKTDPVIESDLVWPCEGYICDWGSFKEKKDSMVKGQKLDLSLIFSQDRKIDDNYYFVNVFLHNHNYHYVHAPVTGHIKRITRIAGDLIFLRPWFYERSDVSYPSFRNERVIYEIEDAEKKVWYLAMVGGFGVGSIEVFSQADENSEVRVGQQIGRFKLGSTVCIASPYSLVSENYLQTVVVGQKIKKNKTTSNENI